MNLDQHVCPKSSARYRHAIFDKQLCHATHQWLGHFRGRSLSETGAPALTRITVQSELGDEQDLTAYIQDRTVELAFFIGEDAQVGDFIGHPSRLCLTIAFADAKQDNQPGLDCSHCLIANTHSCLGYPLHNCFHNLTPAFGAVACFITWLTLPGFNG